MYTPAIKFEEDTLQIIDQSLLPGKFKYISLSNLDDSITAIKELKVRGAPAIGIVAAYTMYLQAKQLIGKSSDIFIRELNIFSALLSEARPTAVNLAWAIKRIKLIYQKKSIESISNIVNQIKQEAIKIHEEDRIACEKMGENGLTVVPDPCTVLTHCNTGSLATGGWGTALGIIYAAKESGREVKVFVDETRPLGQGARLTFWELIQNNIPCTLITDSTAGSLMKSGKIDLVLFGADRIAENGDVANKIGSYSVAALAYLNKIPCYAVAPTSTFDLSIKTGKNIPIEKRSPQEILHIYGYNFNLPEVATVYNPAFDVTPGNYLTGIITEAGIINRPSKKTVAEIVIPFLKEKK
jgi:methylthioribose-1-phosphate isomerase